MTTHVWLCQTHEKLEALATLQRLQSNLIAHTSALLSMPYAQTACIKAAEAMRKLTQNVGALCADAEQVAGLQAHNQQLRAACQDLEKKLVIAEASHLETRAEADCLRRERAVGHHLWRCMMFTRHLSVLHILGTSESKLSSISNWQTILVHQRRSPCADSHAISYVVVRKVS